MKTLTYKKKNPYCETEVAAALTGVNRHLEIDRISIANQEFGYAHWE